MLERSLLWWPEKLALEHGRVPDALGIDLPVPVPFPKTPLPLGNIPGTKLKGYLILGAGGSRWGRVTGLEVEYGPNVTAPSSWEQVWRMDFHGAHEESGKDLANWSSGPFHYHVLE